MRMWFQYNQSYMPLLGNVHKSLLINAL